MASSFNFSSCKLKYSSFPTLQLEYSSSSSLQLKCSSSSSRRLKYSSPPSLRLKYSSPPSLRLKYSSPPSLRLKCSSPHSRRLKYSSPPSYRLKDFPSSSRQIEYQVFLSFRGEDTRRNFTTQLLQVLKDTGMNVFYDEEKLERGKQLSLALSQAISASDLSIIILSADYASSKSCLAELSDIMDRMRTGQHIVLPIFYYVDPSDVQNLRGSFKSSFNEHESTRPLDEVKRWKGDFAQVGKLKGIHIKGDRSETEHIKHIVEYAMQKLMKHQVFLSSGEDTRLNFTSHLLKALEDTGISVFSDKVEIQISEAIAAPILSIIVLSEDYASSESCLAQLSGIMGHKRAQKHIVLPIFYHVEPSDVRNLGGNFRASFDDHESNGLPQVQQWKEDFVEVGKLKGWHIEGGKFDRSDTEYIKDVVQYIIKKLNRKSRNVSHDLVGLDDQKETILRLIEQEDSRVIGLWGAGGIGKTTLADAIYNEISSEFQSRCFLQNVREEMEKKGMKSVRNELLSKLLDDKIDIDTPSIGSPLTQKRLKNIKTIVVLDDVNDSEQINLMGVKYFGEGSKIIVTSRDRQVLKNGGADNIHELNKLNENDSLQLFSTFAFKLLNPPLDFQDLSNKFLDYAQGNPLALKVLGSKLYTKSRKEWESEVDKLKEYAQPKISHILRWSFDELDELEKNIFLDVACFLKGEQKDDVEKVLSYLYKGAMCGISNLLDKCLLNIDSYRCISMHDMLEEMGKDIVRQVSKDPGKRSRLWSLKDLNQVLKSNEVNKSIEGIKLHKSQIEELLLSCPGFKNMLSLRYIHFYVPYLIHDILIPPLRDYHKSAVLANSVDSVSLPDELRYLRWDCYPFKSLSSNFNPKNLVVLKLQSGHMEQLWNENYKDLVNLREIDVRFCERLRKIPDLSGAINLQSLRCKKCTSLVELPRLSHLTSLKKLEIEWCFKLKKFPELPNEISELDLSDTGIEEVPDSIQHLVGLRKLRLRYSSVENVSSNISKLEFLRELDLGGCKSLKTLSALPRYMWCLNANDCKSLEKVSFTSHNVSSFHSVHDGDYASRDKQVSMTFLNCKSLNQDSIKNIESNAMLQIQALAQRWARSKEIFGEEYIRGSFGNQLFCSFPGYEISGNEFEHRSLNSWLNLKIKTPNGCRGSRFLAFAIGLVADLGFVEAYHRIRCKYQLTTANGEKFTSDCCVFYRTYWRFDGYHVLIMFSEDMIIIDNDYEEASFEFKIKDHFGREYEVKECGVLVFFVDAESYTVSGCDGM